MSPETPEERGRIFVRGACRQMGLVAVLLLLTMACVRVYAGVIQSHRTLSARLARIEVQTEEAVAVLGDRGALQNEVAELLAGRSAFDGLLLRDGRDEILDERLRRVCRDARVSFEGATRLPPRQRGALEAIPYKVRFEGRRHQVPVLMSGILAQPEIVSVTSLDLEVINFVDDRITGALVLELPALRQPPEPDGEIVRPFLVRGLDDASDGPMARLVGPRRRALDEASRSLGILYPALVDYQALTLRRNHLVLEKREIGRLADSRAAVQADVARVLPRVDRALSRSALGRAGFQAEPGGAVELITWD